MSKLSDKEIEHFRELLPDGVAIVDFRKIKTLEDFIATYCNPKYMTTLEHTQIQLMSSIERFINQVKNK